MKRYSVIMAGGGGTRFWPLSRSNLPKQYLKLSGNETLLNQTILRLVKIISPSETFIVTGENQKEVLKEVLLDEVPHSNVMVESIGRNTAPCILYAALKLLKKNGDGVMCVFPSDHYIRDIPRFQKVLLGAINIAQETNNLVTIGIKPTFPSTGYGYIQFDKDTSFNEGYAVRKFVEKPDFGTAQKYFEQGNYLWNSGMFIWKISVIINNYQRFLPRMYEQLMTIEDTFWSPREAEALKNVYGQLQNISIDYGIMERSNEVFVVPGEFGWNDVGSWDSLGAIFQPDKYGNIAKADHISLDTTNSIIYGNGKLIATVGLENMIVVSLEDATLVCPKSRAQDVKKIVEKLKMEDRRQII